MKPPEPGVASAPTPPPTVIVVCGVSGAGKTTLGRALAAALGRDFADADDFHPPANIAKMRAGHPLDDADRAPWLAALRAEIARRLSGEAPPLVLACSALKRRYRDTLRGRGEGPSSAADEGRVRFVFLDGPPAEIAARLAARSGHYMPPALLASQLAALEPPADAIRIDLADTTAAQVAATRSALGL